MSSGNQRSLAQHHVYTSAVPMWPQGYATKCCPAWKITQICCGVQDASAGSESTAPSEEHRQLLSSVTLECVDNGGPAARRRQEAKDELSQSTTPSWCIIKNSVCNIWPIEGCHKPYWLMQPETGDDFVLDLWECPNCVHNISLKNPEILACLLRAGKGRSSQRIKHVHSKLLKKSDRVEKTNDLASWTISESCSNKRASFTSAHLPI